MRHILLALFLTPLVAFTQIDPSTVTIVRDEWGVPHVYGPTDAAAAYGLAYAYAEDHFPDIQQNLMISRGRLGEVEGPEGAAIDFAVQLLRVRDMVNERYEEGVSNSFKEVLAGYCQAMNEYAERHPDELLLKGLFPVTPKDVIVGYQMVMCLMAGVGPSLENIVEGRADDPTYNAPQERGSNAFAFNSRKTKDGSVYLVNNSHQPLDGNLSWYEAHVVSDEGWNCLGGILPGGVSIFAGVNPDMGWAHTVNPSDFTDVFRLEMNPDEKLQYKFDGEWRELEERKIKLKVKLGPVKLKVGKKAYWSVYGATLKGKDGHFYAIRTAANMGVGAAEQWFEMNKAQNFSEFYSALNMGGLSSFNVVYADRSDTIFYIDNGNYPFRDRNYDWSRVLPGDTSATLWEDYHSTEELVQVLQPASGYVFNTNATPFNSSGPLDNPLREDYDPTLGVNKYDNNRSLRFQELMAAYERIDYDDLLRIKYDNQYPDSLSVYFIKNANGFLELDPEAFPHLAEEIEMLRGWDKKADVDSEAAGLFMVYLLTFIEKADKRHETAVRRSYSPAEFAESLEAASKHLLRHFGSIQVPLGEVQRLVRGNEDYPLSGLPDVIRAMTSVKWEKGRYQGYVGETYIQITRFSEQGVEMETVNVFGSSSRPDSPHYDDQVDMYLSQERKPMRLDKDWVMEHAERVYHPGE